LLAVDAHVAGRKRENFINTQKKDRINMQKKHFLFLSIFGLFSLIYLFLRKGNLSFLGVFSLK
jgi:hypothetical protein